MTVTAVFFESLYVTATVVPSVEYADEKCREDLYSVGGEECREGDVFGVKGIALIRPPV